MNLETSLLLLCVGTTVSSKDCFSSFDMVRCEIIISPIIINTLSGAKIYIYYEENLGFSYDGPGYVFFLLFFHCIYLMDNVKVNP